MTGVCCAVRPTHVELVDGQLMCAVCGDIGNGIHFGVVTCEGCKVCDVIIVDDIFFLFTTNQFTVLMML